MLGSCLNSGMKKITLAEVSKSISWICRASSVEISFFVLKFCLSNFNFWLNLVNKLLYPNAVK